MVIDENNEIWIEESRFYLDENNIIHAIIVGEQDVEKAKSFNKATLHLMEKVEGKVHVLTDNNRAGKTSPEARKEFQEFIEHKKYGKLAIFGVNPVARLLANFFIGFSKKKDIRYFKSKKEALSWLLE